MPFRTDETFKYSPAVIPVLKYKKGVES